MNKGEVEKVLRQIQLKKMIDSFRKEFSIKENKQ